MKQFYLIVVSLIAFTNVFSAPVIKAANNGNWNTLSTWDLNRLPQVGDTIMIPFGKTIALTGDQNFSGFVYIMIYGKLALQNNSTSLNLSNTSIIKVYPVGQIVGGGSPSQKIKIGNSTIFDGNDNPILGPQVATSLTNGFIAFIATPLPIKFVGFTVSHRTNAAIIQWSTSEEMNVNMFEVQRSFDGSDWNTIAYVSAIGNSTTLNNYSFNDKNVTVKLAYYRIKETELDGSYSYTTVSSFKNEMTSSIDVKIASVDNKLLLQFPQEIKGNLLVRFISLNGQIAGQKTITDPVGQVVLNSKLTGNYIISVSNGDDVNTSKQVLL